MTRQISIEALKQADIYARQIQQQVDWWLMWEAYPSPYPHLKPDFEARIRSHLRDLVFNIDKAVGKHAVDQS